MVLDLSLVSVVHFVTIITLLVVYSILDLKYRRVKNELVLAGVVIGFAITLLMGHFVASVALHATAFLLTIPLAYILFRLGSIGGADAKVLFIVSLFSPGIELGNWNQPVLEAILGLGGELLVMLLGGYLYWRIKRKNEENASPLLPFLLLGYLVVQIFALF
jgi:prepilin signal peptidase PulO-like enzyme (type II secretory pathway)